MQIEFNENTFEFEFCEKSKYFKFDFELLESPNEIAGLNEFEKFLDSLNSLSLKNRLMFNDLYYDILGDIEDKFFYVEQIDFWESKSENMKKLENSKEVFI